MEDISRVKANIFAYIFKLSNTLQVYLDKELEHDGITAKQFFLMIAVNSFGSNYPTYKQVADISSSSYQNVKQIALKLEKNGYLNITNDINDKRAKRIILTKQSIDYWHKRDFEDIESMNILFQDFKDEEVLDLFAYINRLIDGIKRL